MKKSARFSASPDTIAREVGAEVVLLDLASSTYFGLDPVGARIWQLLTAGNTLGDVCQTMLQEFDVTEPMIEKDVGELVEQFVTKKLLVAQGS